ncbi:MAG: nuclear transport factor 2 family protein [Candidatus Sulfotelmatobacter sp.]
MLKRLLTLSLFLLTLTVSSFAQPAKSAAKKSSAGSAPDKAYLQKLLAGWSAMDTAGMTQYYVQGDYTFFDIAPLKYRNWTEYQNGVAGLLKNYASFKLTLNDDAQIHREGDVVWSSATVEEDAVTTAGKHEMATMRWTVIFQKIEGKWLIVHEHTSEPLQ